MGSSLHCLLQLLTLFCTGETDWKVLVIDVNDPMASQINGMIITFSPVTHSLNVHTFVYQIHKHNNTIHMFMILFKQTYENVNGSEHGYQ